LFINTSLNSDLSDLSANQLDNSTALTQGVSFSSPKDGYLAVSSATASNPGSVRIDVKDTNNNILAGITIRESPSSASVQSLFVRKGMVIYPDTLGGNSSAYFRTLKQ